MLSASVCCRPFPRVVTALCCCSFGRRHWRATLWHCSRGSATSGGSATERKRHAGNLLPFVPQLFNCVTCSTACLTCRFYTLTSYDGSREQYPLLTLSSVRLQTWSWVFGWLAWLVICYYLVLASQHQAYLAATCQALVIASLTSVLRDSRFNHSSCLLTASVKLRNSLCG